jgi:hypothetical protein
MLVKKNINKIRSKFTVSPEQLFSLSPNLPIHFGISEKELLDLTYERNYEN